MDGLDLYRARRDFSRTPEPEAGSRDDGDGFFVVQKHAATRLHYDFRLAVGGVLKSWAVTRGPSFDPSERRLAVRTEDHPIAYAAFEGTIPADQYGGGTVMLWDRGRFETEGDVARAIEAGKVKLTLHGERLKGGYTLVRMRSGGKRESRRENWLLIKERDDAAAPGRDIEDLDTSIASGRNMSAIAEGRRAPARRRRKAGLPAFVRPQLATLTEQAPTGDDWLFELKFDGYRMLASVDGAEVRCSTRAGQDWTARFAPIAAALRRLGLTGALIDGEVVVADPSGRTDFGALQRALKEDPDALAFFAFDLLAEGGEDLRGLAQRERKERLRTLLARAEPPIHYSDHVEGSGRRVAAEACRRNLEGVVAKRADAPYRSGRTRAWLKVKCVNRQEFVIGGWTPSSRGRPFSSLLLGTRRDGELLYAGRVGAGFDGPMLDELAAKLRSRARSTSPFAEVPGSVRRSARWVRPDLVAEVRFAEFTREGRVRHAVFEGLREDKPAAEVRWELPDPADPPEEAPPPAKRRRTALSGRAGPTRTEVRIADVALSNPGRLLYPQMGVTKQALAEYLAAAAEFALPHLRGRPVSLVRCPQGRQRSCFFQKHATAGLPPGVETVAIAEKRGGSKEYLVIGGRQGLVGCAQIGALELHGWAARRDRIEAPDRMVFDLDPAEDVPFADVRRAALDLREILEEAGLDSLPLLTGGKGIHLVIPLERRQGWEVFAGFARAFAVAVERLDPARFVATASKAKRHGRIYIDHLRNRRGATAILPFSPRAREGAPIAAPVTWRELSRIERAGAFSLTDPSVLKRRAEAWAGSEGLRSRLTIRGAARIGVKLDDLARGR